VKHVVVILCGAKVIKGIKNIFKKVLARKKKVCIFALGFERAVYQDIITDFKDTKQ